MPTLLLALSLIIAAWLQPDDLEDDALRVLELLNQGQYESAWRGFDDVMQSRLPPARLAAVWEQNLATYGGLQQALETQVTQAGAYTAVNIRAQFEAAVVNVRVVYNQAGLVSGLFFYPLEVTGQIRPAFTAALAFSALFAVLFPLALAAVARRRLGVSWKYFFYGVGIFALFQLFTRIPLVAAAQGVVGPYLYASPGLLAAWLAALALSAGLFEEVGRYVGYRWLMARDHRTWAVAVMFGLGHGGFEAMVLVGINNLAGAGLILAHPLLDGLLPRDAMIPVLQQLAAYAVAPPWLPLLAAWERLWSILFHVALAVLVLQVFRRGSRGDRRAWLWLAVGLHTLGNLLAAGLPIMLGLGYAVSSAIIAGLGLLALWIIWRFRETDQPAGHEIAARA